MIAHILPWFSESYDWPTLLEIQQSEHKHSSRKLEIIKHDNGLLRFKYWSVFIPEENDKLQLRVLGVSHTWSAGHRRYEPTISTLKKHFNWATVKEDTKTFLDSCIYCLSTMDSKIIPSPLVHAFHGTKPNETIHFDHFFMEAGIEGYQYILIVKFDLLGYVFLLPTSEADSETTAKVLVEWFTTIGVAHTWISDQVSNFKNRLIEKIRESLHTHHLFTLPDSPWANGPSK